jgi:hypothetical protein
MLDLQELYLSQPSHEYRQAFDLAADYLNMAEGKALCTLSSAFHAVELLKRSPRSSEIVGTGSFDVSGFISAAADWAWGELRAVELDGLSPGYDIHIWAEPEDPQADVISHQLRALAVHQTRLVVINSGPLRSILPIWKTQPQPGIRPLSMRRVTQILQTADWQVENSRVFHGPRSIAWSFLCRACTVLKRPDWSDRLLFAMRTSYQDPGWIWWLSPLSLICARAA